MSRPPEVSVVIPTFARLGRLKTCLQAVAGQDLPPEDFEVIVVDDGSPAPPEADVESATGIRTRLVIQTHGGPASARNTGAERAQGKFLAFTDDDCIPDAGWLSALAARLRQTPDRIIGGLTVNGLPGNPYSAASQELVELLYAHYNVLPQRARFFTSNNMALSASLFQEVGGFDKYFPFAAAEDRDLCERWLARGFGMTFAAEAVIRHSHALTFGSFWRQQFNYGRGAFHFHRRRSQRAGGPVRPEPLGFYWNLLVDPFGRDRLKRQGGPVIALLALAAQVANAAGYSWEAMAGGDLRQG